MSGTSLMTPSDDVSDVSRIAVSIARYRKDFRAYAREQLKIAGAPFSFWPCQVPLIESVERQMLERGLARVVWLKARQVGASTLAEGLVTWRATLWPHVNAIVIADEQERSKNLFEISKGFYEQMDPDIRPIGRYATRRELVFANPSLASRASDPGLRSRIVVDSAHKKNIAIGANWQVAHLSECARFPDPKLVLDGVIPAVHRVPGTMVIMESSAEKAGTWFRDFCESSQRGQTAFEFAFVPWILQPEYYICPVCKLSGLHCQMLGVHEKKAARITLSADERSVMVEFGLKPGHIIWMREKLAEMDNNWDLFYQSYPLTPDQAWVTDGINAFPIKKLQQQRENIRPPYRYANVYPGPSVLDALAGDGMLSIWKNPEPGKAYDIGVDVAMGLAQKDERDDIDASCAIVVERGTGEQVAEWHSKKTDPLELATLLYWLGTYYNQAQVAVEMNAGMGGATNAQLAKLGYVNLYMWRYRDEIVPRYSKKTGWETNSKSKPWLVGFAIHELINDRVVIRSELLIKEMFNFVRVDVQKWEAVAGSHDDRVMAWMIAILISDDENFERYYGLRKSVEIKEDRQPVRKPEPWEADLTWMKKAPERLDQPWE